MAHHRACGAVLLHHLELQAGHVQNQGSLERAERAEVKGMLTDLSTGISKLLPEPSLLAKAVVSLISWLDTFGLMKPGLYRQVGEFPETWLDELLGGSIPHLCEDSPVQEACCLHLMAASLTLLTAASLTLTLIGS